MNSNEMEFINSRLSKIEESLSDIKARQKTMHTRQLQESDASEDTRIRELSAALAVDQCKKSDYGPEGVVNMARAIYDFISEVPTITTVEGSNASSQR